VRKLHSSAHRWEKSPENFPAAGKTEPRKSLATLPRHWGKLGKTGKIFLDKFTAGSGTHSREDPAQGGLPW
jgi:hypothetical protein